MSQQQYQPMTPWLRPATAAKYLGMHRKTLTRLAAAGKVKARKTTSGRGGSGEWRFQRADLDAYLREQGKG